MFWTWDMGLDNLDTVVGPEGILWAVGKYSANNLEFQKGSAEATPGEDYDLVFTNRVLQLCKNTKPLLRLQVT